jgi:regulator of protease activity HflC (stomatin/prohibitin superfamily)
MPLRVIIIIVIIIIIGISFMQGIYTYIPETNHVPRKHRVAAILVLISLLPAVTPMYLYVSIFRSMCAVPNMAVFYSSLTS